MNKELAHAHTLMHAHILSLERKFHLFVDLEVNISTVIILSNVCVAA